MQVTKATEHDIHAVAVLTKQFEQASSFIKVDIAYTTKVYQSNIRSGKGAMFLLKDENKLVGALGCIKANDMHSGELIAIETVWFVDPKHRGGGMKLWHAFDGWAKDQGCKKKAMIHMEDSFAGELEKIYKKKGYKLVERHYVADVI